MEELFIPAADGVLPVDDAEIVRTEQGILCYHWPSPCDALGGLWIYVDENEIMLSTKISHSHVERINFFPEKISEQDLPRRIVNEAIVQIASILQGDVVFTREYGSDGSATGATGTSPLHIWANPELYQTDYSREMLRKGYTQRGWDWSGEVTRS